MKRTTKKTAQRPKEQACKPQDHNFHGLRDILFEELNLLRANRISVGRARVTSQLARRIIEAATMDLFAQNLLGDGTNSSLKRLMSNDTQS